MNNAHKFFCRLGIHSWFRQHDRWGSADVCRYCVAVRRERADGSIDA